MNTDGHLQRVVPPSRRRDKPVVSCSLCRRRKLKCDRQQPCKTCVDRGLSLSCTYVRKAPPTQDSKTPHSVHDRIDQLEKLVTTMMNEKENGHAQASPAAASMSHMGLHENENTADIPGTPDRVRISGGATSYTNGAHWASILDGISELREHLDEIPTSAPSRDGSQADIPGPDLLFGHQRHATKEELLAALPPRSEADQLIAIFFTSMDTSANFLHRPTFLREYNDFWLQPFDTPTMWIGCLYSALALGAQFQASLGDNAPAWQNSNKQSLYSARIDFYREKIVQALILANYTKCPPCTVEALIMYFGCEYLRSADAQFSMSILVGMIVRIAFRMGYHREPSRFSNISPFRAEMRRRAWLMVVSVDLVQSFQVGLPRLIQPFMCDTREPRNLLEEDLHENMTEMPASRPEIELTPMLYSILLTRMRLVHAKVMDLMNATTQPSYREVIELDTHLRQVHDLLPECAKLMPGEEFENAETSASMRRFYLGLSFLKAELVLHRPYLLLGRTDAKYEYSRRVCLNAAIDMLCFQRKIDSEIQPGGRLWAPDVQSFTVSFYTSSVVANDFLLATTVLVLDLDKGLTSRLPSISATPSSGLQLDRGPPGRAEIIDILRAAYDIWTRASVRSHEARKVAAAIRLVLNRAQSSGSQVMDQTYRNTAHEYMDTASPTSSFDFREFTDAAANSNPFPTANNTPFTNDFFTGDMHMNMGTFPGTFDWGGFSSDLLPDPYGQSPRNPLL